MSKKQGPRGPRGGTTTRTGGMVKKSLWLHKDEAEALRKAAFDEYRSEASIIREAVRRYFGLED